MTDRTALEGQLRPTTDALLARAASDADDTREQADRATSAIVRGAQREAASILEAAHAAGVADAIATLHAQRVQAQRDARATQLAARTAAYERVRAAALDAAGRAVEDPRWPAVQRALERLAAQIAGPHSTVLPVPEGGAVATAPGRRVDLSLPALAAQAFVRAAGESRWQP